jgi:DNA mismatch endonuclease, patch repair protein
MADVFSKSKRSEVMAAIRSRDNKSTELRLIGIFRENGVKGWRRGSKLRGRPDFVFSKERLAVFVDGCFWHGCPRHGRRPRSNAEFWNTKIDGNRRRDRRVSKGLRAEGWRVLRIWEHSLASRAGSAALLARIRSALGRGTGATPSRTGVGGMSLSGSTSRSACVRR